MDEEKKHKIKLFFMGLSEKEIQTDDIIDRKNPYFCSSCGKSLPITKDLQEDLTKFLILKCDHTYCIDCIKRFSESQVNNEDNYLLRCPICCDPLNDTEIEKINPEYSEILNSRFIKTLGTVVTCPNCKNDFILEQGEFDENTRDLEGEKFRPEAIECYRKYRVTCTVCRTNFCGNCNKIPFHEAMTCEEKKMFDEGIQCRFCELYPPVGGREKDVCHRVCWHANCQESMKDACEHLCDCGHPCCGLKGEVNHFGCAKCQEEFNCSFCYGSCMNSPSVVMRCGHFAHKSCLVGEYKSLDDTKRLMLPSCNFCGQIPYHDCVHDIAQKWLDYEIVINDIIKDRIDFVKDDDHVKNPDDKDYFGKPEKFARDKFIFYVCDKCKKPYYAGLAACLDGADDNPENDIHKGPHCCMRCNRELMNTVCKKHGEVGMVYKCMFCCEPSLYFCFGTTYFCPKCHEMPHDVQKGPFPECNGHCKFAPHPPNGQKVFTGYCVICEQEKEEQMMHE